jgi:CHASE3 domain sensor protein
VNTGRLGISHWPLRVKLAAAFLLPLLLLTAQAAATYKTIAINRAAAGSVEHTYQVIAKASETENDLVSLRDAYRSFLLTGGVAYLQPYAEAKQDFAADLQQLEDLAADNLPQVDRWQRIGDIANTWITETADPALANPQAITGAAPGGSLVTGQAQFDQTSRLFDEGVATENQLLQQRAKAAEAANELLLRVLTGGLLVLIVVTVTTAVRLSTSIGGAFARLLAAADRLAKGELHEPMPVDRDDEIGHTAKAFNAMASQVQGLVTNLREQVAQRELADAAVQESNRKLTTGLANWSSATWKARLWRRQRSCCRPAWASMRPTMSSAVCCRGCSPACLWRCASSTTRATWWRSWPALP